MLIGTAVQFAMALPVLKRIGFPLKISFNWRDPRIKQVLTLMLPVTIALGLININLLINSTLGTLVSESAPRAIDAAFRIYMLPAGHVLGGGGDGAVPAAQPPRRPARPARAAPLERRSACGRSSSC